MTVAALLPSIDYLEDGVSLNFAVPFRYLDASDLVITRVLADATVVVLAEGPDWSATPGPTDSGGTLTLVATVAGSTLKIRRATPQAQTIDYATGDTFPAETHELGLDRAMLIAQELAVQVTDLALRAILFPSGEHGVTLPAPAVRAGKIMGFEVGSGAFALLAGAGSSADAALVGFTQTGTGAKLRSVSGKLQEAISPEDFGLRSADDGAIIALALTEAKARGMPLRFTSGIYYVSTPILLTDGMRVEIDAGVTVKATAGFAGAGVFVLGTTTTYNEYMRVEGRGTVDADNRCNYAIDIRQGSRCRVGGLNLHNGVLGGLKIGTTGSSQASVEAHAYELHIEQAVLVANDPASVGLDMQNATDCFVNHIIARGYRKGFHTSSTCAAIDMIQCHAWGWSTNVAMTHAFHMEGGGCNLIQCYADTPFDTTGLLGDLYGYFLHGFSNTLVGCRVFMNTGMAGVAGQTDIGTDGRIICVYQDRETFSTINGITVTGGNTTTYQYKQLFGCDTPGHFDSTFRQNVIDGGATVYTVTTDRQVNWPATISYRTRGAQTFDANVTVAGTLTGQGLLNIEGTAAAFGSNAGLSQDVRLNAAAGAIRALDYLSAGVLRWAARADSTAEGGGNSGSKYQLNAYDDAGSFLANFIDVDRRGGGVIMPNGFGTGPVTAEPTFKRLGLIVLADRVTWDPLAHGAGGPYLAYWNGAVWTALPV